MSALEKIISNLLRAFILAMKKKKKYTKLKILLYNLQRNKRQNNKYNTIHYWTISINIYIYINIIILYFYFEINIIQIGYN